MIKAEGYVLDYETGKSTYGYLSQREMLIDKIKDELPWYLYPARNLIAEYCAISWKCALFAKKSGVTNDTRR